ncbi:SDR family NAD(P)-dependent oxidoreductase [Alcaligenaceae bacterium]|nr:SDR family NAD(P)-dependent oxidoreductase [Alcaligenaceae bacterium]
MTKRFGLTVITGGAQGIGRALSQAFAADGATQVVVLDRDGDKATALAEQLQGRAVAVDVSDGSAFAQALETIEDDIGPISTFVSNAGVAWGFEAPLDNAAYASDEIWNKSWEINVLAHVRAARILVPRMIARGGGTFVQIASAAGLLNQIGSAVYGTTKHAAVGFAENLAISHGAQGIRVALVCPQGVDTALLSSIPVGPERGDGVLTAEAVALATISGLDEGRFLILPHEGVHEYVRQKAENTDRWIRGMGRLAQRFVSNDSEK